MITIENKFLFLTYKRIFFAEKFPALKKTDFVSLRQYSGEIPKNWKEKKFVTLITDLTKSEEEIFSQIAKNTKYEIRRAEKEGVKTGFSSAEEFRIFFNNFAAVKGLKKLSKLNTAAYAPFLTATKAELNSKTLAMHAYLVDKENSRARLLYSATVNRNLQNSDLNCIGRANRFLHWQDILYFKNIGLKKYDWGGIADNPDNPETKGIDAFKEAFGGIPITENTYESPNMRLIK